MGIGTPLGKRAVPVPICASVNGAVCVVGMTEMLYRRGFERSMTFHYYMEPLAGMSNEVREATNKEPHVCGRARVGERPVSSFLRVGEPAVSEAFHVCERPRGPRRENKEVRDATKKERQVCARARVGERPVSHLWTPPSR